MYVCGGVQCVYVEECNVCVPKLQNMDKYIKKIFKF